MINYYSNKKVKIEFDHIPQVSIRYYIPSMNEEERKSIKRYPFTNKTDLKVRLTNKKEHKTYIFNIPKGYCYDGASIPRLFWRIIGSNTDNQFLIPALIHDTLCENHNYIDYDRNFSSEVFNALLEANKINPWKRFLMKHSVNSYQRFCKWQPKSQ